jgi:hypothetical protein
LNGDAVPPGGAAARQLKRSEPAPWLPIITILRAVEFILQIKLFDIQGVENRGCNFCR